MKVKFLGSGDAFGSGGRLQPCILLQSHGMGCLLDCGATAMIAFRKYSVDPNTIDTILISHLHGDHFGGIPFFLLDAQMISKRTAPLTIAGPPGTRQRLHDLMEVMFPGSAGIARKFPTEILELDPENSSRIGELDVTVFPVSHPSGNLSLALRVAAAGRIVAYTGDTEWTDSLLPAARDADLFISEAYLFDKKVRNHLDYPTLLEHLDDLHARRIVLTHMGQNMLENLSSIPFEHAEDGMEIEI